MCVCDGAESGRPHPRRRCGKPVHQRHRPGRWTLRRRGVDPQQSQHRPAHVRGERPGGDDDQRGRPHRAERPRLRRVHVEARGGIAEPGATGGHRAAGPRPARLHAQPPPVVLAEDHAGCREEHRGGARPAAVRQIAATSRRISLGSISPYQPGGRRSPRSRSRIRESRSRRPSPSPTTCCPPPASTTALRGHSRRPS